MGRPSKCTKELLKLTQSYIDDCTQFEDVLPSIAGLSLVLHISRETVYDWTDDKSDRFNAEFSDMIKELLAKQERELLANGLQSVWNPVITKLVLAKHNYTDKFDHTTKGKEFPTPILGGISKEDGTD